MLLLKLTKKSLLFCFFALVLAQPLSAKVQKSCMYKTFNIKIAKNVTISDLIDEIANMCNFSVVSKDHEAQKILEKKLNGINIKNMSLHEVFNLVLSENGINYDYKRNILKLSSIYTKIFKVDYITSVRVGTATINASVTVDPIEIGTKKDSKLLRENSIKVTETFDFWNTLKNELNTLLNGSSINAQSSSENNQTNPKTPQNYQASLIINKNTGLITVTGTKKQIDLTGKYLKELKNRLHKQVMIDVSIIAVELSNSYTTGIDWSKFELSINKFGKNADGTDISTGSAQALFFNTLNNSAKNLNIINSLHFSMEGLINFIKKKGNTKVLSNPKVMTLNNQQAIITIGDNINYRVKQETKVDENGNVEITYTPYSVFIGVLLNLLPEVSEDNKIMLRINPSLSSFKFEEDNEKQVEIREIAPDTLEKKLSTVVQVNSGDTIILGGLIGQTKGKTKTNVPLLSDIPVLGHAFKSTADSVKTTELVFVITPHIINATKTKEIGTSLKDLGFSESLYE